jgi:hypothetical protein
MKFDFKPLFSCGKICKLMFGSPIVDDGQTKIEWNSTNVWFWDENLSWSMTIRL